MGRPRGEPVKIAKIKISVLTGLNNEFPHVSTVSDRVASVLDYYIKTQKGINKVGSFIYGKRNWNEAFKKQKRQRP